MNKTLQPLAIILSMLSLISLIQHSFDVGLKGVFLDFIQYYRLIFSKFIELFHVELPQYFLDLWVLSFVAAGAHIRTDGLENARLFREFKSITTFRYWKPVYFFLIGFTFIGCLFFTSILSPQTYIDEMNLESQIILRKTIRNLFVVIGGMLLFFATNAYTPSLM
ncbi:hypothetical protein GU3_01580 [Oceanimonas sp. GK1]|uniref:hypothetical protein n=1 Tax=Oceanimonas sp. (strain GK1 / IBRC-M 10197) TaxID=511062 RepID=UPI0002494CBF|nr:hypothetical protein [Oceanimonas sp. GK1]AEY00073.1 hypothetical protein GU3_01580 [Oceanimonas sp. GK1]